MENTTSFFIANRAPHVGDHSNKSSKYEAEKPFIDNN